MLSAHQKRVVRRLKVIAGQVKGLQRMVERKEYCFDILRQAAATRQALAATEETILQHHITTHIVPQIRGRRVKNATRELMHIYSLTRKTV